MFRMFRIIKIIFLLMLTCNLHSFGTGVILAGQFHTKISKRIRSLDGNAIHCGTFAGTGVWTYLSESSLTSPTVFAVIEANRTNAFKHAKYVDRVLQLAWQFDIPTATLNYEGNFVDFKKQIERLTSLSSKVVLLMMTSVQIFVDILNQISSQFMESQKYQWIIETNDEATVYLTRKMKNFHQIRLLKLKSNGKVSLLSFQVSKVHAQGIGHGIEELANWQEDATCFSAKVNILPRPKTINFKNKTLSIGVVDVRPYRSPLKQGIDVIEDNLRTTLGETFNFRFQFVNPADGNWGGPLPNGTIAGVVGLAARGEVDFAQDEITITAGRYTVVDFSYPYFFEPVVVVTKAPTPIQNSWAVFTPFSILVWIILILSVFIFGFLLWLLINNMSFGERNSNLSKLVMSVLELIIAKGGVNFNVNSSLIRFMITAYAFLGLVIFAVYSGTLTAVLVSPTYEKPIDSLEDLLRADNFAMIMRKGTMLISLFQTASSGIYKKVYENIRFDTALSDYNYMEAVQKGKRAYLSAKLGASILTSKANKELFHLSRERFFPQSYGIAFPRGSVYVARFSQRLQRLFETGIINKWESEEIFRASIIGHKLSNSSNRLEDGPKTLTITQLQGAFYLYLIGIFLALLISALELCSNKWFA